MKKTLLACAVLVSACSGKGEFIPTPTPAPEPPSTTAAPVVATEAETPAPGFVSPAEDEPEEAPTTTTTAPAPILCEWMDHPAHHYPCPTTTVYAGAKSRPPSEAIPNAPKSTTSSAFLASIRACEQNTNPNAGPTGYASDTGNGYYGAYQFSWSTWASVGGSGNPAHASPAEQDMRAQMMIDAGRRGEWPNC